MSLIKNFALGDSVDGAFILKTAAIKETKDGNPYLDATLADTSGEINCKQWSYNGPLSSADSGKIVIVSGKVTSYRDCLQLGADSIRLAVDTDHVDVSQLIPMAPIDCAAMLGRIERIVGSIADADYRTVCESMMQRHQDTFPTLPAAKSIHHAFIGGLLMHTGNMLQIADYLAGLYPDTVDRDLLLAGTLLHDFGKVKEFSLSHLGLVVDYSTEGQLLGHLVLGAQEVAAVAESLNIPDEKKSLLQHMLLSHHGEPQMGAAVTPVCVESELLHLIDRIDSKTEIYRESLDGIPKGEFTKRIFALDKRVYAH